MKPQSMVAAASSDARQWSHMPEATPSADTLPKLLEHNAVRYPEEVALREKELGIWRTYTWADYAQGVRCRALGLAAIGIQPGEIVGIIGDNRPDWVFCEIAAHAVRAMSLGIYRDALDEEVAYLVNFADVRLLVAEDEEQVDKLLNLGGRIPKVTRIIYCDPRGMKKYDDARLMSVSELDRLGRELGTQQPGLYESLLKSTSGDDLAIVCTTSGTTSHPKLALLSAGRLLRHCASYLSLDPRGPEDEYVSVLPLSWIMEQIYVFGEALLSRMRVSFVEEHETTMPDLREIGPTFVLFAPRVWEQIAADVRARIMEASPLKRAAYQFGMKLGMGALASGGRSKVADWMLFNALRDRLGFSRLKSAATGGAALAPETFRFFQALGVPLRQLYGQTELLGAYTIHRADDISYETVGTPFDGVEVAIKEPDSSGLGEIVCRHENMFHGYLGDEAATSAVLDPAGWLMTGDAGYVDERGHLVVVDRVRDLSTTSTGKKFSPQYIENKLKFSPFIAEAVVLGESQPYLAALVCIRFSIVSRWAEKQGISFTTYTDLSAKSEVYDLVRQEIERINTGLPEAQRIRKFLLLYKELDADDGELTRTRKLRRSVIGEKYARVIEALYGDIAEIDVDAMVAFQDGTKQRVRTRLKAVELSAAGRR
jgi:long-chain acyl-CoA synthetase